MRKSELIAWLACLAEDDSSLAKIDAIRLGNKLDPEETLFSLKELAKVLGYKGCTTLHKLRIQQVGESFGGGRLRYRRSRVENYLKSYECLELREELRRKRRDREGERKKKQGK